MRGLASKTVVVLCMAVGTAGFAKWPDGATPLGRAVIAPKSDSKVTGTVDFAEKNGELLVKGSLANLPAGKHGFHIHEKGDCSAADAASAGGHYNPTAEKHGAPDAKSHHGGDFGNIVADAKGTAEFDQKLEKPHGTPFAGWKDILNRALVVHADADDLTSQPAGNSGKRVGCGTIQAMPASE